MWRYGWLTGLLWLPWLAVAHDARPIAVELRALEDGLTYQVNLRAPDALQRLPELVMPEGCEPVPPATTRQQTGGIVFQQRYRCETSLQGRRVGLSFPGVNPSLSSLFRLETLQGAVHTNVLSPGETIWQVPDQEQPLKVAAQYTWLGVLHIWLGIDHLLFVLCLLFIAGNVGIAQTSGSRWRRVLITITGFTVAHSLTLALSVLGLVSLPVPAVEATIALSIVFLALEILRNDQQSWTYRYPVSVAMSFGLLHGFGFASVLREIGLPQTELPLALLTFNLGVEIGQVVFIAVVMLMALWLAPAFLRHELQVRQAGAYFIGSLAAYWMIDRTLAFWVLA